VPHRTIVVSKELRRFFGEEFGVDATYIAERCERSN